jgi:DHA3 family macrolide efflux protein-like MFS transporter
MTTTTDPRTAAPPPEALAPEADPPAPPLRAWGPRYFTLWSGQAISMIGTASVQFALVWWLTVTTDSATVLATSTLIALLPQIVLGTFAGALVDRLNRRFVMIAADSFAALASLTLALLFASGTVEIWHVYALILCRSIAGAFQLPAMQASTALMVPKQHLARIAGLNDMLMGGVNIVSPVIGALLYRTFAISEVMLIDALTALPAILPLLVLSVPQPPRRDGPRPSFAREYRSGFRYVFAWQALTLLFVWNLIFGLVVFPITSLLPLLIARYFTPDPNLLALVQAVLGGAIIAGGIGLAAWGGFRRRILTVVVGCVVLGVAVVGVGIAANLDSAPLLLFSMGVLGACIPLANGPFIAILQSVTPPQMQGRVISIVNTLGLASGPISLLIVGPLTDRIGVSAWYPIAGVVVALSSVWVYLYRSVRRIEETPPPPVLV